MSTRENYLIAARGGKPEWVPCFTEDVNLFKPDFWGETNPETGTDFCNIKWVANDFGRMPDERWRAMEHISNWRETVKFPVLADLDWEGMYAKHLEVSDPDKVNMSILNTHGIFLIPINMLGWVDGLVSIQTDREELEAFVSALTDFLVELVGYLSKYFKPDIISTGDDVASANGPFISKDTWSSLYKPYFRKITDAIHSHGSMVEFHCCGNCQYLIEEFLDLGSDIVQLPVINDSLRRDKKRFGSRLVITGGWDRSSKALLPGASEEVIRRSARTALDEWGKDGALIFWDGGIAGSSADSDNKRKWLYDEFHKYGRQIYKK